MEISGYVIMGNLGFVTLTKTTLVLKLLLYGTNHLKYYLVLMSIIVEWIFGLWDVFLLNFFKDFPYLKVTVKLDKYLQFFKNVVLQKHLEIKISDNGNI
jgi:hypothetical protein